MSEFISAIPAAATSPYALAAYAICAVIFLLAGSKLRTVRSVLDAISQVPDEDRRGVIESVTGSILPESITADQWIRNNRNRWVFLLIGAALILLATIVVTALVQPTVGPAGPRPSVESAAEVASSFLETMDEGSYTAAYASVDELLKKSNPEKRWTELATTYRLPLGSVESRIDAGSTDAEFSQDGRFYHALALMYFTKFENSAEPIREIISVVTPGEPEPWRVVEYRVDVQP